MKYKYITLKALLLGLLAIGALTLLTPPAKAAWYDPPYQNFTNDDDFLDDVTHRAFLFFSSRSDYGSYPSTYGTGLTQDRSDKNGSDNNTASVASTGWYLASLPIAVERGWMSWDEANWRADNCLRFFSGAHSPSMPTTHGFFRHFVDKHNGTGTSEVSTIDTAIFVCGALIAGQYFGGDALTQANAINGDVEWNWMRTRNGTDPSNTGLALSWNNNTFSSNDYGWSEAVSAYLLGLGTPDSNNKLPTTSWAKVKNYYKPTWYVPGYGNLSVFDKTPIFIPQQPQNFFPFENRWDTNSQNYFDNAVNSTLVHRQFCIDHTSGGSWSPQYNTYGANYWGINACDHPPGQGYKADSAPTSDANGNHVDDDPNHNGVITPTGALAAMPFCKYLPDNYAARAGRAMYDNYRSNIFGKYGFSDAYDYSESWYDSDVIGIDLGMMLCNVENARTGLLWRIMGMTNTAYRAYSSAGLQPVMADGITYVLEPASATGKVVNVVGAGTGNGIRLEIRTASGATSEQWIFKVAEDGYWKLTNINSGKCMEVASSSTTNGAAVQQWSYGSSDNQQWQLIPAGSYSYALVNRNSDKILDASGTANGSLLQQWTDKNNPQSNQTWKFYELPTAPRNLTATAGSSGTKQITIAWERRYNGTGYDVWRATSSTGTLTKVGSNVSTTSYTDTAPSSGVTYWYTVSANNGPALGPLAARISKTAP